MRTLLAVLLLAGLCGCAAVEPHTGGWTRADLDRNRFDLGLFHLRQEAYGPGLVEHRFTGEELAGWTENGEVVAVGGTARLQAGGDLYVVVRYELGSSYWSSSSEPRFECWRFTTPDGYGVELDQEKCP